MKIFKSENQLMRTFIKDFKETDPDFMTGWNFIDFDMDGDDDKDLIRGHLGFSNLLLLENGGDLSRLFDYYHQLSEQNL